MLGWTPSTYDAQNVLASILHTRGKGVGLTNVAGFSNARVDELTDLVGVELDKPKRQAMIDEAAKIVQDQFGYIPLHQQTIIWAAKDNIELTQPADNNFLMRWVRVK
jgi:peptide/nickel transport system substrate-binding protein